MFVWLAIGANRRPISANLPWMAVLVVATAVLLVISGIMLWKRTRFS
jgi:hypothetical protein